MEFIDPRQVPFVPLKSRGELPHLHKPGGCYFVTFRLWDAVVPRADRPLRHNERELSPAELMVGFDPPLRSGSCALQDPPIASMVQAALLHFHQQRYTLIAWCVMPNHVHVVMAPAAGFPLSDILRSWKGFSSRQANKLLHRTGAFWERESFDHLVRTAEDVDRFARYVEDNPVAAGLCRNAADWPYSSAGAAFESPLARR